MFIRKLAFSNFAARKTRVALTLAAVALSVSLVVAVTSGYASLFEAAFKFLNQYMGATDARIVNKTDPFTGVPWKVIEELRADPDVRQADGRLEVESKIRYAATDSDADATDLPEEPAPGAKNSSTDSQTQPASPDKAPATTPRMITKSVRVIGIDRPGDRRVDRMPLEAGQWFSASTGNVAVIDQQVAKLLKIGLGDSFTLPYGKKTLTLKVVGIAHKPAVLAVNMRTAYLPLHTLQDLLPNGPGHVSEALIDLKGQSQPRVFERRWKQKFAAEKSELTLRLAADIHQQMDNNLQGIRLLSYLGGAVSMLSATFIIFTALSMGVSERQRSLAMLRAVGAFKWQIGALVVFEGMILAVAGLLIGIPLGFLWLKILSLWFYKLFTAGAVVSWGGVAFGAGGTLITSLAASLLPAWSATRVSPLEAMSPPAVRPGDRAPVGWAFIGLILIAIDPFLFSDKFVRLVHFLGAAEPAKASRAPKFYLHFALGLPGLFVGFFLLAPLFVWTMERVLGPIVAAVFGLRFTLLRQQLSTGLWRAAGTCAALMVGLAVLVVMQATGYSLLGGWRLPDKFPDVFIRTSGLTPQAEQQLAKTPGFEELMPVTLASPTMGGSPFAIGATMLLPNATLFIGVDPTKAFQMMELEFRQGNPRDAQAHLEHGGWVIVTQEYHQVTGANVGDPIVLGSQTFHIAAVVWSPGIDVMVGMYDMGSQFEQRTISSVFGSNADGKKYFNARPYLYAAELVPGTQRLELIKRIEERLHTQGFQVGDVRDLKDKIETAFYRLLHLLSVVAFAAMAVASLGVTNTIMAGVRSRRWQFGILRSIGVTRSQLLRLVLAEALLLGLIGCILGLAAGFEMTHDANALTTVMTGYDPPLVIPWPLINIGIGAVLFISLSASLWPAISVAKAEPLTLLQAGRASA
ncbi:MAG TPA: FtsX-like permease family protein [Tepidisphaeraceae bacterium]|nr:FtsX-like permease family protein [Tepidisphaeraceae bacterium]